MSSSIKAHKILMDLRKRPITTLSFPSHFSVAIQLRNAMNDPLLGLRAISDIIKKDALIASRVVSQANKASSQVRAKDIEKAIQSIGLEAVKKIVLSVTMVQLTKSSELVKFSALSRLIWLNGIYCASAASVLASTYSTVKPDEAFFSGLILNLGAFYLLYHAAIDPTLRDNMDDVIHAVKDHYLEKTKDILQFLEMDHEIVTGIDIRHHDCDVVSKGYCIQDILCAANRLANERYAWLTDSPDQEATQDYQDHIDAIDALFKKTKSDYQT